MNCNLHIANHYHPHKRFSILILLVILAIPSALAQNLVVGGHAVESSGRLPDDFYNFYNYRSATLMVKKERKIKGQDKFDLQSSFELKALFESGKVLFGDPMGRYVNKVADHLLAGFPDLRKQLRFYVCKSEVANAFCTDQGIIFVNVGLLARIENEAQLAFILSHEITHYVEKHNYVVFTEKEKSQATAKEMEEYRRLSVSERIMRFHKRSKEVEAQADLDGFLRIFSQSPYDLNEAISTFDILLFSQYPFFNVPFNLSLLETDHMKIPTQLLISEADELVADENEADSLSTHPNVKKRKENIRLLLDSMNISKGEKFIEPFSEFEKIKMIARKEVIHQLIIKHRFVESLYLSSVLLSQSPDDYYFNRCFCASIYGLCEYNISGDAYELFGNLGNVRGEMKQVSHLYNNMLLKDWNIVAFAAVWKIHQKFPENTYLATIAYELLNDIITENDVDTSFFYKVPQKDLLQQFKQDSSMTTKENEVMSYSLHPKLDTSFTKFALVDLWGDAELMKWFVCFMGRSDSIDSVNRSSPTVFSPFPVPNHRDPKKTRVYLNSFFMANPFLMVFDSRKKGKTKIAYSETQKCQIELEKQLQSVQNHKRGKFYISSFSSSDSDIIAYNEMVAVNEYIEERLHQTKNEVLLSSESDRINELLKKYDTHYLGWSAVISYRVKKKIGGLILLSIIYPLIPYTVTRLAMPEYRTYNYQVLFDVNTGKIVQAGYFPSRAVVTSKSYLKKNVNRFVKRAEKYYEVM